MISCALGLTHEAAPSEDGRIAQLLARGWQLSDHISCPGLQVGSFYELEAEAASTELYFFGQQKILAARLPWPEEPYSCRRISGPQFIEEIP